LTPPNATLPDAILRTVLYADVFDFALTVAELHHWLLHDRAVSLAELEATLHGLPALSVHDGMVCLQPREAELPALRARRMAISAALTEEIAHCGRWLARLPFVRMVGLTGALAMGNPTHLRDDFDFVLVTATGRVWLTRLLAVLVVRLVRLRGREICPNYVMDADAMAQRRRDLYIAHEVTQIVPLYGDSVYDALRAANGWTAQMLPNAAQAFSRAPVVLTRADRLFKRLTEGMFGGRLGDALDNWEQRRKQRRWASNIRPDSAAALDAHQVKGHFDDHGAIVLRQYAERLRAYGLIDEVFESAAD
jgi:hypothetical protein